MTEPDDAPRTAAGLAARAAGALVLDGLLNGAVLLSLITLIAGVLTHRPGWIALGVLVGLAGMVVTWWAIARRWRDRRALLLAVAVLVVQITTLALLWKLA